MKSWKHRLNGEKNHIVSKNGKAEEITESLEALKQKRDQITYRTGMKQFNKAVLEAELLQDNQELLRLNNEISKKDKPLQESFIKAAPEPEVLPADPIAPKLDYLNI